MDSRLSDVLLDWLADDGLSDDWLGDFVNDWRRNDGLGQDWRSIAVNGLLRIVSGLGVLDSLVSVVDHAGVVFADARVWSINSLGDVADGAMVRSHDVLFGRSMLVVSIRDWSCGINLVCWLMMVARHVLWLVAVHCWLGDVSFLLRERDLLERR